MTTTRALTLAPTAVTAVLVLAGSTNAAVTALHVPPPTGPFHVGTYSIALTDPARRDPQDAKHARSLVIQLWYPTPDQGRRAPYMSPAVAKFLAKSAGVRPELLEGVKLDATLDAAPLQRKAGWPVVLFSPGYGVERELYTGLTADLASHGYVVVALDHPPRRRHRRVPRRPCRPPTRAAGYRKGSLDSHCRHTFCPHPSRPTRSIGSLLGRSRPRPRRHVRTLARRSRRRIDDARRSPRPAPAPTWTDCSSSPHGRED